MKKENKIRKKDDILHDLKRIAKTLNLLKQESDKIRDESIRRNTTIGLLADELDNLNKDVERLLNNNNNSSTNNERKS